SGLQKQVLSLYRRALRMTRSKPPEAQLKFRLFVNYHFHKNASSILARDVGTVEYLLRQGTKQIEMYENKSIRDCWVTNEMLDWAR
ncbi:uncharacterized protein EI90DRAFT_2891704, partial [Cantharellus anzutake]|uniref:uncharacterized protein n=1 Tax=Cantharellus anzutake TaxID=1750568 RepID=UPI001906624A